MTGPQYPPGPQPGSNGIGSFTIGVSPIGDIAPFNIWQTIVSQYANSPIIDSLILAFDAAVDQTNNYEALFDNIWNVDSAVGYGLDVWGRIVGISRVLHIPTLNYFGFQEAGAVGFGGAPFFSGVPATTNYVLDDATYLNLILAKAAANITNGSIPAMNAILMALFPGRGNCWVSDGPPPSDYFGFQESGTAQGFGQGPFYGGQTIPRMVIQYNFNFILSNVDLAIINSGVLPKPVGVAASIAIVPSE